MFEAPNLVQNYVHHSGRLFVVGDLHGCYELLMNQLTNLQFNFEQDLLVSVGDLVDRGPDSLKCLNLIDAPWFKAVLGNHEEMCLQSHVDHSMARLHAQHGGEWFYALSIEHQQQLIEKLKTVPVVLEIEFKNKKYGFVHADIDVNDWSKFKSAIQLQHGKTREIALWGRSRIYNRYGLFSKFKTVQGIEQIFLGHTIVKEVTQRDNCLYIDTGAYLGHPLTIIEIK